MLRNTLGTNTIKALCHIGLVLYLLPFQAPLLRTYAREVSDTHLNSHTHIQTSYTAACGAHCCSLHYTLATDDQASAGYCPYSTVPVLSTLTNNRLSVYLLYWPRRTPFTLTPLAATHSRALWVSRSSVSLVSQGRRKLICTGPAGEL